MTVSTLISMVIGTFIPALVVVITKDSMPEHVKVLLTLLLTTISGVLSSLLGSLPTTFSGWEHVVLNILMTFATAAAADWAGWRSGASKKLAERTARFGIGTR